MGHLWENVTLAISGLKSNKMRALLTMLGIIIGIGSVIAIVTVGDALTNSVTSSMQSLGATNIMVAIQEKTMDGSGVSMSFDMPLTPGADDLITDEMLENFMTVYGNDVDAISLSESVGAGVARDSRKYANLTVTGVNSGYSQANNIEMTEGRFINERDVAGSKNVCVVSDWLVNALFSNNTDPLGQEIKVSLGQRIETYTIVGIYHYSDSIFKMMGGTSSEKDTRTGFYIPVSTAKKLSSADAGYSMIIVMASVNSNNEQLTKDLKTFFSSYYENNPRFTAMTINMETMVSRMSDVLGTLSIAVAVIAAISLLVGGIGVMNIMLVSVTERTREIGTRKALGARNSYIRLQFIVEAVIICCIGGILGIGVGIGLGSFGAMLLGYPASPSFPVIVIAVGFSMLIGIFFGYYPANKAAKLDPIDALRYE